MAASQRFVGAHTPLGIIVQVEARLFNPTALVRATDGTTAEYRLPFLIALGVTVTTQEAAA